MDHSSEDWVVSHIIPVWSAHARNLGIIDHREQPQNSWQIIHLEQKLLDPFYCYPHVVSALVWCRDNAKERYELLELPSGYWLAFQSKDDAIFFNLLKNV